MLGRASYGWPGALRMSPTGIKGEHRHRLRLRGRRTPVVDPWGGRIGIGILGWSGSHGAHPIAIRIGQLCGATSMPLGGLYAVVARRPAHRLWVGNTSFGIERNVANLHRCGLGSMTSPSSIGNLSFRGWHAPLTARSPCTGGLVALLRSTSALPWHGSILGVLMHLAGAARTSAMGVAGIGVHLWCVMGLKGMLPALLDWGAACLLITAVPLALCSRNAPGWLGLLVPIILLCPWGGTALCAPHPLRGVLGLRELPNPSLVWWAAPFLFDVLV